MESPKRRSTQLSRTAREYRLRLLQTYLAREGEADRIVKRTEEALTALLLSGEITSRTLPGILREFDKLLDQQERDLRALITGGLQEVARTTVDRTIAAQ